MKENEVDIMHLHAISNVLLDCDEERTGMVSKKQLFMKIAEQNLQFPADFLFNLIYDIQENQDDLSENAQLNYQNLKNIIEIYSNCPLFLKGDSNNSTNFKASLDYNRDIVTKEERIDKLIKYVHARIEEKFKDFRQAFRNFDKDFGGSLDFKEFIQGMECIGVKFKLEDYKLIFEKLDYDKEGSIDFFKFCLLNTDKHHDLSKLISKKQQVSGKVSAQKGKKPPLPPLSISGSGQDISRQSVNPLFGDGNIPKNKDMNNFTKDIQSMTPTQHFMQERKLQTTKLFGFKNFTDMPLNHSFGVKNQRDHDMVSLLRNSYQDDLNRVTLDSLKSSLSRKPLPPAKYTNAQFLRQKATRQKYNSLNRSNSIRDQKVVKKNHFIIKGNNSFHNTMYVSRGESKVKQDMQ